MCVGAVTYSGQDAFFDAGTVTLGIETRHLRGSSVAYYASCCGHARAVRASVWSGRVCAWVWATYRCGIGRVRCAQEGDTRCLSPSSVVCWTGLCFLLRSRERGSSQRAVGACSCGCGQRTAGRVRSLTQLPSLWESAETRRLAHHRLRSGLVYPAAVTRERFEPACGQDVCVCVRGQRTVLW